MINHIIQQLSEPNPTFEVVSDRYLDINEFSVNTIQGEGAGMGYPASFLRLQGCTLDCVWCDTAWRLGARYSFEDVFYRMGHAGLIPKYREGQRIVLTGGSPLKQQEHLVSFFFEFESWFGFRPIIEIENECTLIPNNEMKLLVDVWNNSPKLESSGMKKRARYKPDVLKHFIDMPNSWFKFVIAKEKEIEEIYEDFIQPGFVKKEQVILMPLAATPSELSSNRKQVMEWCISNGFRYSTREQLVLEMP